MYAFRLMYCKQFWQLPKQQSQATDSHADFSELVFYDEIAKKYS